LAKIDISEPIPALVPGGSGHQFVLYSDACSGIPGALHERTFASINRIVQRLRPRPDFILFPGDEIVGLTGDPDQLRQQWRHWISQEMNWLNRQAIPIWHTTSNHTVYDAISAEIFREMLDPPRNGPPRQEGLSYWVRRGDLLLVFVNTVWSGLGGEGHVETDWLGAVLGQHRDARYKLVIGHHPIHPINGFSGPYQREIGPEHAKLFWTTLVEAGVLAYLCSHILAFDVQVHRGVLQVCSAGAGTAHRMPDGIEYLHCVQAAIDEAGLRYQVLDANGLVRERLQWPIPAAPSEGWTALPLGETKAFHTGRLGADEILMFHFSGRAASGGASGEQTLLSAFTVDTLAPLWIGLRGPNQTITAIIGRESGRSPSYWLGPDISLGERFELHLLVHPGMGPGGILYRLTDKAPWSSLTAASAIGPEQLDWPERWSVGHAQNGSRDRPFLGTDLTAKSAAAALRTSSS
jgi:hypothetical protein